MLGVESSSCSFESSPNNTIKFDEDDIININSTIASNDQHKEHQDNSSLSKPNSSNSSEESNCGTQEGSVIHINNIEVSFSQDSSFKSVYSSDSNPIPDSNPADKTSLQENHNPNQSACLADPHHPQNRLPPFYYYFDKGTLFLEIGDEVHKIVVEYNGVEKEMSVDTKVHSVFLECEKELMHKHYDFLSGQYPDESKKKIAGMVYEILYVKRTDKDSPIDKMREEVEKKRSEKVEKNQDPEPYIRNEDKVRGYIYNLTRKK